MLAIIDPIVPILSRDVPLGREWRHELKLDGFRGTLYVENGGAVFRSKTKRVMRRFQDLANSLARTLPVRSAILDGEIVVIGNSTTDCDALMQARGEPEYATFDIVWLNGEVDSLRAAGGGLGDGVTEALAPTAATPHANISTSSFLLLPRMSYFFPTLMNASIALSRCCFSCAAESCVRMRA